MGFTIRVNSSRAIGYDEYAGNYRIPDVTSFLYSFMGVKNEEGLFKELASSGLIQNRQIISTKQVGKEGTRSRTLINGTGQVSLTTETRNNNTSENSLSTLYNGEGFLLKRSLTGFRNRDILSNATHMCHETGSWGCAGLLDGEPPRQ